MKKGFAVTTVIELVIAAIILLLLFPMIIKVSAQVWETIAMSLGLITPSNVERAVECAYYRCTEGCASVRMNEIAWVEGTETIRCLKFCADEKFYEGGDLKICTNSRKYPVNVTISKTPYVNQKHIGTVATCIVDSKSYSSWVTVWDENFIYVDDSVHLKNVVRTDDCAGRQLNGQPKIGSAIESADIEDKTVYISSYYGGCPVSWCSGMGSNNLVTEITATPPSTECKSSGSTCYSKDDCCSGVCVAVSIQPFVGKCA